MYRQVGQQLGYAQLVRPKQGYPAYHRPGTSMSDLFVPKQGKLYNVQAVWESTQHLELSKILWTNIASNTYP